MSELQSLEQLKEIFWPSSNSKVATSAMLLAITSTIKGEEKIKSLIRSEGLKMAVTEVGGKNNGDFQDKLTRAVMGGCLNNGIIEKTSSAIHALLHAVEEAKKGILVNTSTSASLALKVAVVRDEHWIGVAIYGQSAIHPITNHHRAGLGMMHL
jgi:hut operon positive regulatory protein